MMMMMMMMMLLLLLLLLLCVVDVGLSQRNCQKPICRMKSWMTSQLLFQEKLVKKHTTDYSKFDSLVQQQKDEEDEEEATTSCGISQCF